MATISFKAGDEYALKLSRLAAGSDDVAKKAIYEGAKVVADKIKSNLESKVYADATGDLIASFGITPIARDKDGNRKTKNGFDGYDRKGVPTQLKARVLESGSSRQQKKPYVRPAVNATKKKAIDVMKKVIDEETERLMGGK